MKERIFNFIYGLFCVIFWCIFIIIFYFVLFMMSKFDSKEKEAPHKHKKKKIYIHPCIDFLY